MILRTVLAALLGAVGTAALLDVAARRWHADAAVTADLAAVASVADISADREELRRAIARTPSGRAGRLAVHLAGGTVGTADPTAPGDRVRERVVGPGGVVVVEVVEAAGDDAGATLAVAAAVGLAGVGTAALGLAVARRRIGRVEDELRAVVSAAHALGAGDLTLRATSEHVAELAAVAAGLNAVSDRVAELREAEHRVVADLSHRLRTPLTALALDVEAIGDGPTADRIRSAVGVLNHDIDGLIHAVSAGETAPPACDAIAVISARMDFWCALAGQHDRGATLRTVRGRATVALPADKLAAVVDALLGNVFRYTPPRSAFGVEVVRHAGWVTVVVDDAGPGVADPAAALRRGVSGAGSTGLGLAIARDAVTATGGTLHIERSGLGGARVRLRFAEVGLTHPDPREPRAWRLWGGHPQQRPKAAPTRDDSHGE